MSAVIFFIAAIGALAGAIGVIALRNAFYSVLALVCHLICLAALFLLLRAQFVAAAQVVVYAGAVMVLYVFVVAYVGGEDEPTTGFAGGADRPRGALRVLAPLFGLAIAVELCIALLGTALKGITGKGAPFIPGFGTPRQIGAEFLTTYLFPFEVASLLLLVAAIGSVVLARRRRGLEPDEEDDARLRPDRPVFTGTMAEVAGLRPGGGTTPQPERQTEPIGAQSARGAQQGTQEGGW
ncbi:MAG: NADH-quinone oxidoreductase subunit J family protein [Solirubrobacteraceae bacterium]